MPAPRARLSAHLEATYGIAVTQLSPLDRTVFRVDRSDGPPWVARIFAERPVEAVEGDAAILRRLEESGFPAERVVGPVSTMDDQPVLVTGLVPGAAAPPRPGTFARLGVMLGRLHEHPVRAVRPGGAWHHICPQGTPADELAAADRLLAAAVDRPAERKALASLRAALAEVDDGADLPAAFGHPDMVPVNAIAGADGGLVIVDWAGAGLGPRVWSLGFLLWAAGAHDLRLVDWVVSRYRRHITLEPDELARLPAAIRGRPLTLECWQVGHGYRSPTRALAGVRRDALLADRIAEQARQAFIAT
jgi:Ser/Thr protein kinase RdoA (MazF antagonist)